MNGPASHILTDAAVFRGELQRSAALVRNCSDDHVFDLDNRGFAGVEEEMKIISLGIVFGLLAALFIGNVKARDLDGRYANSPLHDWFEHLKSSGGSLCCSDADGTALSDVDWETKNGHYRVRIDGAWYDVPDDAVIKEPNRAGKTMVWPYRSGTEILFIRCFMPGALI